MSFDRRGCVSFGRRGLTHVFPYLIGPGQSRKHMFLQFCHSNLEPDQFTP